MSPPTRMVPPFMSMPCARADRATADQIAAANRRAEGGPGVLFDQNRARHHVLAARPADTARDANVRAVNQADAEIAERAFDDQVQAAQDADADGVLARAGPFSTIVP